MNQNLTGIWKADLAKCKLIGQAPKSISIKIRHSEPDLSVVMIINMHTSAEHFIPFSGAVTGKEFFNDVNGQQWRSRMQWVGTELLIESWVDIGERKAHFRDFWYLSNEAQTLTMEHRDDDLKGQLTILNRVA